MNAVVTRASMEFAITFKTDLAVRAVLAGLGLCVIMTIMNAVVIHASMESAITFKTDLAVHAMLAGRGLYATRASDEGSKQESNKFFDSSLFQFHQQQRFTTKQVQKILWQGSINILKLRKQALKASVEDYC
eukprot:gene14807-5912_t